MEKELMLVNEAIARGAYEAGVVVSTACPNKISMEINQELAKYKQICREWSANEKVALKVAIEASKKGARAMASMTGEKLKTVAEPLFNSSYDGVNGGLIIVLVDNYGVDSYGDEQDIRMFARAAKIPVLEPSDSQEVKDFVIESFEISEVYNTPVILRIPMKVFRSESLVETGERLEVFKKPFNKKSLENIFTFKTAVKRNAKVNYHLGLLEDDASIMEHINEMVLGTREFGFVTSGICYQYVKEVFPDASILKLGLVYPLPKERLKAFSKAVEKLIIVEELEPFMEEQIKAMGIECTGKELFPREGEYSKDLLRDVLKR